MDEIQKEYKRIKAIFKDSDEKNITIYFTSKWFEEKMGNNSSKFHFFMNSASSYLLINDENRQSDNFYESFLALAQRKENSQKNEIEKK